MAVLNFIRRTIDIRRKFHAFLKNDITLILYAAQLVEKYYFSDSYNLKKLRTV